MKNPKTATLTFLATVTLALAAGLAASCPGRALADAGGPHAEPRLDDEYEAVDGCFDEPAVFRVGRGETLTHYARWSGIPIGVIADDNGLAGDARLREGQALLLCVDEETAADVALRRRCFQVRRPGAAGRWRGDGRSTTVGARTTHDLRSDACTLDGAV